MGSSGDVNWKLEDHPKLPKGKTIGLIVLDGWGESEPDQYNCIHKAPTPAMDSLKNGRPDTWRLIKAHGTAVGLPSEDDMGNSEVGHNALGAGRIYAQGAKLVDLALESGKIYEDEGFKYISEAFEKGTVHLIGLLSDGGVHSRLDQVQLLLKGFAERGAKRIRVHILTDGRDVLDGSSVGFVETLESELAELRSKGVDAQVASGGGRMYVTMDRYENDWTVVKRGWDAQFGHVTFFWNGNRSGYFNEKLEKYVEIPSDSGISFNEQPKMKALEIAEKARDAILSGNFDQVRVNLPNGDMVGHTGDLDATVVACEAADVAVRMILDAIEKVGGIYVVTADHGNAEDMVKRDKAGKPALDKEGKLQILTSHTLKPVPIAIGGPGLSAGVRFRQDLDTPGLANVAATVMNLHGFVAPGDYEPSLIEVVDK
ncbi:hypothetical protein IGI04_020821 [Brassica rapa subsp. trilocularis]|uniref:phosphoglycerate mutase (2,3-diphosphoglycerate-independent) n=1 Tax=Brassica rapa subsp. trilocularis TaxID=1813537 RepID=A0ABQ7MJV4_BRACM|nr:hypothetical protein IGI04_020821 [Brassica rapa subsp. trilocularis]